MIRASRKTILKGLFWISLLIETIASGILLAATFYVKRNLSQRIRSKPIADPSQFGLNYTRISFPSRDGLLLQGWWFESKKEHPVIILLHGIRANRAEPQNRVFGIARELIGHGYNVMTFDFRAHGESEGNDISIGYFEKNDLLGAVDYIRQKGIHGKIGVLGFSMGAATSLMGAAECPEISAVVADSAFVDIVSLIKFKFSKWGGLSAVLIPIFVLAARMLYKLDFRKIRPLDAVKIIKVPVFIIHGGKDDTVPVSHAYRLRSACRNRYNQFWVVPEAAHTDAFAKRTDEYLNRVLSFFNKAFALT